MKEYEKYLNDEIKNFSQIRELLAQDKIKTIPHKIDHCSSNNKHNEALIGFFDIDKKNTVSNLNEIFTKVEKDYKFYYPFSLQELYKKQEYEEDKEYYSNCQLEIILPYIKGSKHFSKIMKPLKYFVENKYNSNIHVNNEENKLCLTVYKYIDRNNELEVIETNHISKYPIYGLLYYINLDLYSLKNKFLVLQSLETIRVNEEEISILKRFFMNIQSFNTMFDLDIKTSYDGKTIDLKFYDSNEKELLSFESFEIDFLITCLSSFYSFRNLLENLSLVNIYIYVYHSDNEIKIDFYNKDNKHENIRIEKDIVLMRSILDDIFKDYGIGIFNTIKYIFNTQLYTDNIIEKKVYFNYRTQKYILKEIQGMIK